MNQKVAAITGGSGTLGKAFAKGLAEQGATVFILNRNQEKAANAVEELKKAGLTISSIPCDVLDETSVESAVAQILQKAGRIDILVNCAGGNMKGATVMPDC